MPSRDRYYFPIDTLLNRATVRVLRVLRRFDWADRYDILNALGGDETVDLSGALMNLHQRGLVERRGIARPDYRITEAGRAELARLFAQPEMTQCT